MPSALSRRRNLTDTVALESHADAITRSACCQDMCLLRTLGYEQGKMLVFESLKARDSMNRAERRDHIRQILETCIVSRHSDSGYCKMEWKIGDKMKTRVSGVCKDCFCNVYGVSPSHVDMVVRELKTGTTNSSQVFSDHSTSPLAVLAGLRRVAKSFGIHLTKRQVAAAKLPNSPVVLSAYGWMLDHFKLVGDYQPNLGGEIHLEPRHIVEIYREYTLDLQHAEIPAVSVDQFASIWTNCLPYVKIREFKAVTGKCQCCADLSTLRRTHKSQMDREYVTTMHALHRSAYMGERAAYAERRNKAIMQKSSFMSCISDGMAQNHCILPHFGNQNSWGADSLPQHLQGVLNHNRGIIIYRTFHTVNNCANVAMHCFLDTLQKTINAEGKLPDTVFYQIDGGPENTAYCWFALCELIVARRLCKRLVLTRLMVGHTHEDIDSKYGTLWKKIRSKYVYTPQQYKDHIESALSTKKSRCTVEDLFAIPDYKKLLDAHTDKRLNAQIKGEKTQLQWTFEAVTPDPVYFKHGVRVFYRAYCAEDVVQIVADPTKRCGIYAKVVDVFDYPMRDVRRGIMVDGMRILDSLPFELPSPYSFSEGSREVLDNVMIKVRTDFHQKHSVALDEWNAWARDEAPAVDTVEEYVQQHPLNIPLGDILFSGEPIDQTEVHLPNDGRNICSDLTRMRTTDCVKWSRWGFKRDDYHSENFARVERCTINGDVVERSALPAQVNIFRKWKRRKKLSPDEVGKFKFVLGRSIPNDMSSSFTRQGQVVSIRNGGHRIYWKNKRGGEFYPDNPPDKSFERKLDGGWIAFGEIDSPPDGVGNQGVVLLRDIADVSTRAQSISSNNGGGVVLSDASVDCESSSEDDNIMQCSTSQSASHHHARRLRTTCNTRRCRPETDSMSSAEVDNQFETASSMISRRKNKGRRIKNLRKRHKTIQLSDISDEEDCVDNYSSSRDSVVVDKTQASERYESDSSDSSCSSDDLQLYAVGEKIRNIYNFNGSVIGYKDGRYDIEFIDGEIIRGIRQKELKPAIKPSGKKKTNTSGRWDIEVVPNTDWVDTGAVGAAPVLIGKRNRKRIENYSY